ncbi:MAG: 3-oxoacyl-ACP reductase FabG [Gammaproteobacteria bacterium]
MNDGICAVVTGASRGIGKSIARALADAGYIVVGTATGDAGINTIEAELSAHNSTVVALVLDVTSDASIEHFMMELDERGLKPQILVNNAGVIRDNLLLRMKNEEWDAVVATNLTAVFKLSKRLLRPMLKARTGRIINIGSVVGAIGNPGQSNYGAAKAGMIGLTKSLAREVANRGITVNVIAPGFIDTDMTQALAPESREEMLGQIPAGRLGTAEEIALAVVYLASDSAAYITGETLNINGGMHMI